jgi:hypothetical protein
VKRGAEYACVVAGFGYAEVDIRRDETSVLLENALDGRCHEAEAAGSDSATENNRVGREERDKIHQTETDPFGDPVEDGHRRGVAGERRVDYRVSDRILVLMGSVQRGVLQRGPGDGRSGC